MFYTITLFYGKTVSKGNSKVQANLEPWVAHDINKVFAKVSKNIFKVKIEKVWH